NLNNLTKGKMTKFISMKVPMRDTGAELLVVVMKHL
ncbi:hypothetical protein BMETH_29781892961252, partial [methanotrophic bacterial endosymbiont of Bathymodiolus sp.]